MANPIDFVKAHKVGAGIGAVIVVVIVMVLMRGGGGSSDGSAAQSASASDTSAVAAGLQLQQIQAQSAAASENVQAQKEVGLAKIASDNEIAKITAAAGNTANEMSMTLGLAQIGASADVTKYTSSLEASTRAAEIKAASDRDAEMFANLTAQTQANKDIALASTNATVQISQINKPQTGLFSWLFG